MIDFFNYYNIHLSRERSRATAPTTSKHEPSCQLTSTEKGDTLKELPAPCCSPQRLLLLLLMLAPYSSTTQPSYCLMTLSDSLCLKTMCFTVWMFDVKLTIQDSWFHSGCFSVGDSTLPSYSGTKKKRSLESSGYPRHLKGCCTVFVIVPWSFLCIRPGSYILGSCGHILVWPGYGVISCFFSAPLCPLLASSLRWPRRCGSDVA